MGSIFIDPSTLPSDGWGFIQLMFLFCVYGKVLMVSADMIGEGAEMLLLVPSLAQVVGSVLLPVLGAVPDGAIVLFSGLGSNAQEELNVGIGALAGSTIMLLTIPWALSVMGGIVNLDRKGKPTYKKPKDAPKDWVKFDPKNCWNPVSVGCAVTDPIRKICTVMMATSVSYFIIQGASFAYSKDSTSTLSNREMIFAATGLAICVVFFFAYIYSQYLITLKHGSSIVTEEIQRRTAVNAIQRGLTLRTVVAPYIGINDPNVRNLTEGVVKPFFLEFDIDKSNTINLSELTALLESMGERPSHEEITAIMQQFDTDSNQTLDLDEFVSFALEYIGKTMQDQGDSKPRGISPESKEGGLELIEQGNPLTQQLLPEGDVVEVKGGDEEDTGVEVEEDVPELPDEWKHLSVEDAQKKICRRSALLITVGTGLCLLFSDAMVAVLSEIGARINVSSFYVSFVLAPFISNATELVASYRYALKKTEKTMTISLSIHPGAAVMNNTFVLGIFLLLIVAKNLAWSFASETIIIVIAEAFIALMALKRVHTLLDAYLILLFFPVSLLIVWGMQKAGLD